MNRNRTREAAFGRKCALSPKRGRRCRVKLRNHVARRSRRKSFRVQRPNSDHFNESIDTSVAVFKHEARHRSASEAAARCDGNRSSCADTKAHHNRRVLCPAVDHVSIFVCAVAPERLPNAADLFLDVDRGRPRAVRREAPPAHDLDRS